MDQLGNDLKKVLQAGIGAVATGLEKAQDAIEDLSKKGEPIYEQAKQAVTDAVGKAKQAINDQTKPQVDEFVNNLQKFSSDELNKIRAALDSLTAKAGEQKDAPAEESNAQIENPEDGDKA